MSRATDSSRPRLDAPLVALTVLAPDGQVRLATGGWSAVGDGRTPPGTDSTPGFDGSSGVDRGADAPGGAGLNYLVAAGADEADARRAADGVRAVLDGERERFTLEYACEPADERRWVCLNARPAAIGGRRHVVVTTLNVTDRKRAELAADHRAARVELSLDRAQALLWSVTAGVSQARSRSEAETAACEGVVAADCCRFAWVGRPDLRTDDLRPAEWAGDPPPSFDERSLAVDARDPTAAAYRTGDPQVEAPGEVATDWDPADRWDAATVAAVPLTHREKTYGVLTLYATAGSAFRDHLRGFLVPLGQTVATAVDALTAGRQPRPESVVELEVRVKRPDEYFADLTAATGAVVRHEASMVDGDGNIVVYAAVEGAGAATVREHAANRAEIRDLGVVTVTDDELLVALTLGGALPAAVLDHDGTVTALSASAGTVAVTATFPNEVRARSAFEYLRERYDDVDMRAYREREREADTATGFTAAVEDALTDRQLTALRTAYESGYFEWPRPVSGNDVAESMDITRATFHQHLREAERKLASALFESAVPE